jgi:hypothetical protein
MANWHAYRCIFRGTGTFAVGDRPLDFGDIVVLSDEDASRKVKTSDIGTFLEYLGEVDAGSGYLSENIEQYINGKTGMLKKNVLPMVAVDIPLADTALDSAGVKILADLNPQRSLMLDKVVAYCGALPATGDGAGALNTDNRVQMLLTKGESGDAAQVVYGALDDNGSLSTLTMTSTVTLSSMVYLQDTLYLGSTSKFASVYVNVTNTNSNGGYVHSVKYWNGSSWTAFSNVADLTVRASAPLAADGVIAWFEKPSNWSTKSPTASAHRAVNSGTALTSGVYWVAIQYKTDGSATTLDSSVTVANVWVPGDEPLAEIDMIAVADGEETIDLRETFDSVVQQDNTTLEEVSASTSSMITDWTTPNATDDALYVAYADIFGGILVDVGTTANSNASTLTASYWNGAAWVSIGATDGTASGGACFAQDGAITWNIPIDWRREEVTSAMLDSQTLDTETSTDTLFWIKVSWSANLTNGFDVNRVYPIRTPVVPIEFNVTANTRLAPSDVLNLYVGENEAETDALTNVRLQLIGADI